MCAAFFCLIQLTIGVKGNVILLGRPSNCKQGEGLISICRSATCIYNCSMESPGLLESIIIGDVQSDVSDTDCSSYTSSDTDSKKQSKLGHG